MYKDLNGDGKISKGASTWDDHGDLKILGDSNPHYFYGIDLTANYKGFDFRCFLQGVLKHDFWPGESSYFWGVRGGYSKWYTIGLEQHNDYFRDQPIGLAGYELPVRKILIKRALELKIKKNKVVICKMQDICV